MSENNSYTPITPTSEDVVASIRRKTALTLPDDPSAAGMRAETIRRRFWEAICGADASVLAELTRIIEEANGALAEMDQRTKDGVEQARQAALSAEEKAVSVVEDAKEAAISAAEVAILDEIADAKRAGEQAVADAMEAKNEAKSAADDAKQAVADATETLKNSVGKNANALKGSVTGEAVRMDDVSPVEHEMAAKVSSINIFDSKSIVIGGIVGTTGADWVTDTNVCSEYMTIKPNTTYYYGGSDLKWNRIHEYDKNRTWIRRIVLNTDGSITTSGNAAFLRVSFIKSDSSSFTEDELTTIRQEEMWMSDTATAYTPYIEDVSAVKVLKFGKNLLPYPYSFTTQSKSGVSGSIAEDGRISLSGTATTTVSFEIKSFKVKKGVEYTLSLDLDSSHFSSNTCQVWLRKDSGVLADHLYLICKDRPKVFTPLADGNVTLIGQVYGGCTVDLHFKALLELGNTATDHEQYIEPTEHTVNADGTVTGVISLSTTTTLMTDTEGAIIDVEYNRDLNKAFDELKNAIIALGGMYNV